MATGPKTEKKRINKYISNREGKGERIGQEKESKLMDLSFSRSQCVPRITSNMQIAPPRELEVDKFNRLMEESGVLNKSAEERDSETAVWSSSRNSKKRRRSNRSFGNKEVRKGKIVNETTDSLVALGEERVPRIRRRVPRTAAVAMKGVSSEFSYAEALKRARKDISIDELGIQNPRIRRAMNSGLIIEISGPDNKKKVMS